MSYQYYPMMGKTIYPVASSPFKYYRDWKIFNNLRKYSHVSSKGKYKFKDVTETFVEWRCE